MTEIDYDGQKVDGEVFVKVGEAPPEKLEEVKKVALERLEAADDPITRRLKRLGGRRLTRMAIESRYKYFPPGSSWKRRDGTIAKAGPRYGAPLDPDPETDPPAPSE